MNAPLPASPPPVNPPPVNPPLTLSQRFWRRYWSRLRRRFWLNARRVVIFVVGITVLAAGIVMMVTPGPGIAGIVGGLAILATEFAWARWVLKQVKSRIDEYMPTMTSTETPPTEEKPADGKPNEAKPTATNPTEIKPTEMAASKPVTPESSALKTGPAP